MLGSFRGLLSSEICRAPVATIDRLPMVMEVNPAVPAKTVPEFIAYTRVNPGKINIASVGNGSTPHLRTQLAAACETFHAPTDGRGRPRFSRSVTPV